MINRSTDGNASIRLNTEGFNEFTIKQFKDEHSSEVVSECAMRAPVATATESAAVKVRSNTLLLPMKSGATSIVITIHDPNDATKTYKLILPVSDTTTSGVIAMHAGPFSPNTLPDDGGYGGGGGSGCPAGFLEYSIPSCGVSVCCPSDGAGATFDTTHCTITCM
jgi:hypothetical protein